ncbi:MAG TPA: hypothetical protein VH063_13500 [Gaiellaceae bacterium]|jgi:hypothetical protein|nr:hypothetical protein [Gaiellaceae bacterium]
MEGSLTRRDAVAGAAVAALDLSGLYALVDRFAGSPPRRRAVVGVLPEQHLLQGVRVAHTSGVAVLVPPLHHEVVTAVVRVDAGELKDARAALERELAALERRYEPTPAGLEIVVAWGAPYFARLVPGAAARHLPFDRRAGRPALLDARRFPSDPDDTVLEGNDVAILLRSDQIAHVDDAREAILGLGLLRVTSRRRGFVGGSAGGGDSLVRRMALAADVPGAERIPFGAELFLGFASTQKASMGSGKIANFETLGLVDLRGSAYFREGTHMHLSHIAEDLEAWYGRFDFGERVEAAFRPNLTVTAGSQVLPQGSQELFRLGDVSWQHQLSGAIGHSSSIQPVSRLQAEATGPDGTRYPRGTPIPIRADFNTLDNPFAESVGAVGKRPQAGLHFVAFNPSSDDFERNRLAMDGVYPTANLGLEARSHAQGINSVLRTTHRQNFLVPPRRHRSFPLAELG